MRLRLRLHQLNLQLGALDREFLDNRVLIGDFDRELICLHIEGGRLQLSFDQLLLNRPVLDA